MTLITINGRTGLETDEEQNALCQQLILDARRNPDDDARVRKFGDALELYYIGGTTARYANVLRPLVARYNTRAAEAFVLVRRAHEAYAELSNPHVTGWHAAHHRWTVATVAARDALAALVALAEELHAREEEVVGLSRNCLRPELIPAEHRFTMPDLDTIRLDLAAFIEGSSERFTLTAVTLAGTYPAGFEPAQQQETPR